MGEAKRRKNQSSDNDYGRSVNRPVFPKDIIDYAYSIQQRYAEKDSAERILRMNQTPKHEISSLYDRIYPHIKKSVGEDEARRQIRRMKRIAEIQPTTPLTSTVMEMHLMDLANKIINISERGGFSIDMNNLFLSTIPTKSLTAFATKNSWDGYKYIFVDAELLIFIHSVSKIFAASFPKENNGSYVSLSLDDFKLSEGILRNFDDLFSSTLINGSATSSEPWAPSEDDIPIIDLLRNGAQLFVVGHEIAHFACLHFEGSDVQEIKDGDFQFQEVLFSRKCEHEADVLGAMFAYCAFAQDMDPALAVVGPYMAMQIIRVVDECYKVFGINRYSSASSHPPPLDRLEVIKDTLIEIVPADRKDHAITLLDSFKLMFDVIEKRAIVIMERLKSEGKRPGNTPREMLRPSVERPAILGMEPSEKFEMMVSRLRCLGV